jgi:hypothetical protein
MGTMLTGLLGLAFFLGAPALGAEDVRISAPLHAIGLDRGAFVCELTFDLSGFGGNSAAYAGLTVPMNIEGPDYALLRLCAEEADGSRTLVAVTCPNAGHKAAMFDLTHFVNRRLPGGVLNFRLEQTAGSEIGISPISGRSAVLGVYGGGASPEDLQAICTPVWQSARMVNESVLSVSVNGATAEGRLLFAPTGNVRVRNDTLDKTYQEGVDYLLEGNRIILTGQSAIPFLREKQLYPDSPGGEFKAVEGWKGGYVAAAEGMAEHQLAVSYDHAGQWNGPVPSAGGTRLPRTRARLQAGLPLKIALLGDSISFGASASRGRPPHLPGWGELLIRSLRSRYQSEITFVNPSRGGGNSNWGVKVAPDFVVSEKPDLMIIAFGMNDANGTTADSYIKNINEIMGMVTAEHPETEFILVASMMRNENWRSMELMRGYLPALKTLDSERVAVADVWSVSEYILQTKSYADISGNHINHPNDFMVRIYAQIAEALLQP